MDFAEYTERYRLKSQEWAEKDGEASRLEHMRKVLLGELVNQLEGAIGLREHQAHDHPRYRQHVEEMTRARTAANVARGQMRAMEMNWESWRTVNATRRQEMRSHG